MTIPFLLSIANLVAGCFLALFLKLDLEPSRARRIFWRGLGVLMVTTAFYLPIGVA